jgi:phytoene dehydrogenase-like protein
MYDAIIIGSGPNGLSAGVALAREGCSVLVLEAGPTPGGGARTEELTLPGYFHDVCSAVHPLAPTSAFFRELGIEDGIEWIEPPVLLAHPLDDGTAAVMTRSVEETAESFHNAGDARRYRRLAEPFARRWLDLSKDVLGPLGLPRHPVLMARFGWHAAGSCRSLCRPFESDLARAYLAGHAAHSTLSMDQRPSAAFALVLSLSGHAVGWPFPEGGASAITNFLVERLTEHGGSLACGRPVKAWSDLPPAKVYLFDSSPRQIADICQEQFPERYLRKLRGFIAGPGVFKLDWALSDPIPWTNEACRQAGVIHIGGTFEEIAASEHAVWTGDVPERPYVLLAQQSLFDPTRAPEGGQVGWAYGHLPNGCNVDMTDAIEAQVERFAPGFRDCIRARSVMGPADMEQHNPNLHGGDITGGAPMLRQIIARPIVGPNPYATPHPKVFICSASTPPGGGVHGMSGWHAAQAALKRLR